MTNNLTDTELGRLLESYGNELTSGERDSHAVIRDVLESLAKHQDIRSREKTVDGDGRVSVGRDKSGINGLFLFHPDADPDADSADTDADADNSEDA